jgi:hypothetical protein
MVMRFLLGVCLVLAAVAVVRLETAPSAESVVRPSAASAAVTAATAGPGARRPPRHLSHPRPPRPRWAAGLGRDVLIEAPTQDPRPGTPQWIVASYVKHLVSADGGSACGYLVAGSSAYCAAGYTRNIGGGYGVTYSYSSFGLGYAAIYEGNKALVGTLRTGLCDQPWEVNCVPDNSDPAALLNSGQSFGELWWAAHHPGTGYVLTSLRKVGRTWYIDTAAILGG